LRKRLLFVLAVTLAAVIGFAGPASAHVTVNAPGATQGGYSVLTFRVPTESATASTTKVQVRFPTDTPIASVLVQPHPGWTFKTVTAKLDKPVTTDDGDSITEAVAEIDWTADSAADAIKPGEFDQFLVSAGPLHDDTSGERIGFILTLTDITERKRAEEHQTMLVAELNHRVKNILAVVQSVASQTVASSPSLAQFRTAFEGRVRAISLAHDILTQLRWGEVELEHLVARSLAPYRGGERVAWSGPPLRLAASSVVSLAMVLHELSTNAAKYGAFANGQGRVEIAWRQLDADKAELTWTERGGPPLAGEPKPGFGNKLISRVIAYDLQGSATMRFEPAGLSCRLTFRIPSGVHNEAAEADAAAEAPAALVSSH